MTTDFAVLNYLVSFPGRPIGAEELERALNLYRGQAESAVNRLKSAGYHIFVNGAGAVRLEELTDVLDVNSILLMLKDRGVDCDVSFNRITDSTNIDAKRLSAGGFRGLAVCECQTAGKGRRGRAFASKSGGVYFSYVFHPKHMSVADIQRVVLLAGVGVCDALEGWGIHAELKWPNDIYCGEKKLGGVLCEMTAEDNRVSTLIIGVGVNVNNELPEELLPVATSVSKETDKPCMRSELIADIVRKITDYRVEERGFAEVLNRCRALSNTVGKQVYVLSETGRISAKAVAIDESGFLVIETKEGQTRVISGDVSVRSV